jgi:hypothetical protein
VDDSRRILDGDMLFYAKERDKRDSESRNGKPRKIEKEM